MVSIVITKVVRQIIIETTYGPIFLLFCNSLIHVTIPVDRTYGRGRSKSIHFSHRTNIEYRGNQQKDKGKWHAGARISFCITYQHIYDKYFL